MCFRLKTPELPTGLHNISERLDLNDNKQAADCLKNFTFLFHYPLTCQALSLYFGWRASDKRNCLIPITPGFGFMIKKRDYFVSVIRLNLDLQYICEWHKIRFYASQIRYLISLSRTS